MNVARNIYLAVAQQGISTKRQNCLYSRFCKMFFETSIGVSTYSLQPRQAKAILNKRAMALKISALQWYCE